MTIARQSIHTADRSHPTLPPDVAATITARAAELDSSPRFPREDIEGLARAGLLALPSLGGVGLAALLRAVGRCNLSVGRLYEGHINAASLIDHFGTAAQRQRLLADCAAGRLHAVWNTDATDPVALVPAPGGRWRLAGRKILASGAGEIERPLVTATLPAGERQMVLLHLPRGDRADLAAWTAQGMRASLTGSVDLSGLEVTTEDLFGAPGDYLREPDFSGGAWRFAAVQLGGAEALAQALRDDLTASGRQSDPHQAGRFAEIAAALETGRLWVEEAARRMERGTDASEDLVAYVNLARLEVERVCLLVLDRAERSIGLRAFLRPHPVERIGRDLSTYLRQPAPDRARMVAAERLLGADRPIACFWG